MIKKKLVFTKQDRLELDRLIEKLDHIEIDSNDLSPITAGACGEQCMVTCAHYCESKCAVSCDRGCTSECQFNCKFTCDKNCTDILAPTFSNPLPPYFIY